HPRAPPAQEEGRARRARGRRAGCRAYAARPPLVMSMLPAAEHKRAAVEAMFDRIAHRYDLMNRVMTFGIDRAWRRLTIASLELRPSALLVDLACGTGDLTVEAADAGARAIGVDVSAGMLREARGRGAPCAWVRADALSLPLSEGCCDAVV